jgi:hypothetical protein
VKTFGRIALAVYEAVWEALFYFFAFSLIYEAHPVGGGIMLALAVASTITEKFAQRAMGRELRAKTAEVERLEEVLADAEDELDDLYQAKGAVTA